MRSSDVTRNLERRPRTTSRLVYLYASDGLLCMRVPRVHVTTAKALALSRARAGERGARVNSTVRNSYAVGTNVAMKMAR